MNRQDVGQGECFFSSGFSEPEEDTESEQRIGGIDSLETQQRIGAGDLVSQHPHEVAAVTPIETDLMLRDRHGAHASSRDLHGRGYGSAIHSGLIYQRSRESW